MPEAQQQPQPEEEVDTSKVLKAVEQIRGSLDKRDFTFSEKLFIAGYLFASFLSETEDEETHPRDTVLAGLEILNNALHDIEGEDEDEEPET